MFGSNLTNNQLLAQYLANLMKKHEIDNTNYVSVAQITGRSVTDLDVFLSKKAYNILSNELIIQEPLNPEKDTLISGLAEISKTPRLFIDTNYGEIEFFERENTGFPSEYFSLNNLKKNRMLDNDESAFNYIMQMLKKIHKDN
jgi:hypothetical protein